MKTVSIQDLSKKLEARDENDLFIDVRSSDEFGKEHIQGFENRPSDKVEEWGRECQGKTVYLLGFVEARPKEIEDALTKLFPDGIFFICEGGFLAWKEAGKETVKQPKDIRDAKKEVKKLEKEKHSFSGAVKDEFTKTKKAFIRLSVARQEFVIVGVLLLFSLIFDAVGMIIVFALGILFLFSGISGRAVFRNFLKKMPWSKK